MQSPEATDREPLKDTHIPEPIVQLQRELDQFRSTRQRRTKLPEWLWQAAVELARQHGVYSVEQPVRLDYMGQPSRHSSNSSRRIRHRWRVASASSSGRAEEIRIQWTASGAALPGQACRGSILWMCIRVSEPAWDGDSAGEL